MSKSNPTFDVQVTSTTNVFPSSPQGSETTISLSIADNTTVKFSRCAAIWYFDASTNSSLVTATSLRISLSNTLNSYSHFGGRLTWSHPKGSATGYISRYRRAHITYNTPADIGIPFITATSPRTLLDFLPQTIEWKSWDTTELPSSELVPSIPLSLSQQNLPENSPNMVIQHTKFSCGGSAISISITHGLSDAQTLSNFVNDWSSISKALISNSPLPTLSPIFNPQLLDEIAAGDINASSPDPKIQKAARSLPMHRFDWYSQVSNQPWGDRTPPDFPQNVELSPGIAIPWDQWDTNLPVSSRVFHFTPQQIQEIYHSASKEGQLKISKHDALIAHLWSRINIARNQNPEKETESHLNFSIGLRRRLDLPAKFVGSPITLATVSSSITSPPSDLAKKISKTLKTFTAEAIANLLHDEAFEVDPQRIWRGCLGRDHVMVTSWVYSGVGEVDFGGGRVRWVEPRMAPFDGLCAVMEGMGDAAKGHWARFGVDVWVCLERGSMERLDRDEGLHHVEGRE